MISGYVRATAEAFADALLRHYPKGALWALEEGTRFSAFLYGVGDELARIQNRLVDLLEIESDWTKTDELLEDWERVAALPDVCNVNPSTDKAVRRQQLHGKMTASGGQSPSYLKEIADRVSGESCTITEFATPHIWDLSIPNEDVDYFQAGDPAGTLLAQYSSEVSELICLMEKLKPAHSRIIYTFPNDDPLT